MGWPLGWTCLDPMNALEYKKWLMGFDNDEKGNRQSETVPDVRETDDSTVLREASGGQGCMAQEEILQSYMREHKDRYIEVGLAVAGKEVSEEELRSLWDRQEITSTSHRRQLQEHRSGEPSDPLHLVSQIYPSYGRQAWVEGTWESTVPRVASGVAHRVDRLKAIGNGQVPAVVRRAWRVLTDDFI